MLMAIALKSVDALQEHLRGVLEHADRQAGGINEVLLAVIGGILWRKNPGEPVRVGDKNGAGGNIIWFRIGAQRYALLYKYKAGRIELMLDSRHGHVLHAFTNATPLADVVRVFSTLGLNDEAAPALPMPAASTPSESESESESESAPEVVEATKVEPVAAAEPPTPSIAEEAAPKKASSRARKPAATAETEQVEPAAKAPRAKRSAKADVPPPSVAGQLPLVGVSDTAPKPATARKRRTSVKASPETIEAAAPAVVPPSESAAVEAKPRARSRSKSALQPA
jgi:hypothetical protein